MKPVDYPVKKMQNKPLNINTINGPERAGANHHGKNLNISKRILFFCFVLLGFAFLGHAEDKKADTYQPLYAEPLAAKPLKNVVSRIIEFPFLLAKWPIDKSLYYTEEYKLDKKSKWIYDQMTDYGFRPRLDSIDFNGYPAYGADFDLMRLIRKKEDFPDLLATASISHAPTTYFEVGSEIGLQRIAGTGFHTSGFMQYENRRDETFYGIGSRSSLGDSTSYIEEKTVVGASAGYEFSPTMDFTGKVIYDHTNIKNRAHDGKGDIPRIFAGQNIPGLYGDSLLKFLAGFTRDTRDNREEATKGSYQKLLFGFTEGVNSSPARYFTYQIDAAKYFRLASPRRILVTRFFGEFNQQINRGTVPFYEMTKLGGSGMSPRLGETQRAFVYNRFTGQSALLLNLEYRYAVWQHREFKMSTAFFLDIGQVSKDFASFRMSAFRESYGMGFILSYNQIMLLNFSVAHGDEGTKFYIDTGMPF